jgi:hypothetical protein
MAFSTSTVNSVRENKQDLQYINSSDCEHCPVCTTRKFSIQKQFTEFCCCKWYYYLEKVNWEEGRKTNVARHKFLPVKHIPPQYIGEESVLIYTE